MSTDFDRAADVLRSGGLIAYPTEHCFGLGCDPDNEETVERLIELKQRQRSQGVILICGSWQQAEKRVEIDSSPQLEEIQKSWPGPTTWLLPALQKNQDWLSGEHNTLAIRWTAHLTASTLCQIFGGAIVSTSANVHGESALLTHQAVQQEFAGQIDFVLNGAVGGDAAPSQIRHGVSGQRLR